MRIITRVGMIPTLADMMVQKTNRLYPRSDVLIGQHNQTREEYADAIVKKFDNVFTELVNMILRKTNRMYPRSDIVVKNITYLLKRRQTCYCRYLTTKSWLE